MNRFHPFLRYGYFQLYLCLTLCMGLGGVAKSQQLPVPDDYLTKEFHKGRRDAARKLMPANSVMVLFASPERNYANDVSYKYHPDPDLYYFSGYTEPNAVLLIFSDDQKAGDGTTYNEVIFVQKKDPRMEQWTGTRLGVDGAKSKLGFSRAFTGAEFEKEAPDLSRFAKVIFEYPTDLFETRGAGSISQLVKVFEKKAGLEKGGESTIGDRKAFANITSTLRQIKTPEELELLRRAIDISCLAHNEAMKAGGKDKSELELQGVQEFVHKKLGAESVGYPSIVGAGNNGCVLHYIENNATRSGNNLVLMDVGAEYHGYTADVTRTFPANGKFSPEQKAIYNIVLAAQEAAFKECKAGSSFARVETTARNVVAEGLVKLGIISKTEENFRYYPHGCSHFLGLDVHDKGHYEDLKENMVITVEPGIYIPEGSPCDKKWWGIAVRIEDDVLIGKDGPEVLSLLSPRSVEEIEKMTSQKSFTDALSFPLPKKAGKK